MKHAQQMSRPQIIGLAIVFLWFFIGGIAHFVATDLEATIVPPYIPWPVAAVLVKRVKERWVLVAVGVLVLGIRLFQVGHAVFGYLYR